MAVLAFDAAVVDVDAGHAPVVLVASVPALAEVGGLKHLFAPTRKDGYAELVNPFARETQLVVLAVVVGGECIGDENVRFAAVHADAVYQQGVGVGAAHRIGHHDHEEGRVVQRRHGVGSGRAAEEGRGAPPVAAMRYGGDVQRGAVAAEDHAVVGPYVHAVERVLDAYLHAVALLAAIGIGDSNHCRASAKAGGGAVLLARAPGVGVWLVAAVGMHRGTAAALVGTAAHHIIDGEAKVYVVKYFHRVEEKASVEVGNLEDVGARTEVGAARRRGAVVEPEEAVGDRRTADVDADAPRAGLVASYVLHRGVDGGRQWVGNSEIRGHHAAVAVAEDRGVGASTEVADAAVGAPPHAEVAPVVV